jgi:hypothetical protein
MVMKDNVAVRIRMDFGYGSGKPKMTQKIEKREEIPSLEVMDVLF